MTPVIRLSDISMKRDNREILSHVSLDVNQGDFLAVTGPNGGGKTTLLRILLKLLQPTAGSVTYFYNGKPCRQLPIGYLPQKNMVDARFPITVKEVISSGLLGTVTQSAHERRERITEILKLVELHSHENKSIGNLSGGQLQRALLGRALISRPQILVLDEPLSYLDKHFEVTHLPYNSRHRAIHHNNPCKPRNERNIHNGQPPHNCGPYTPRMLRPPTLRTNRLPIAVTCPIPGQTSLCGYPILQIHQSAFFEPNAINII